MNQHLLYMVIRTDDNGVTVIIKDGLAWLDAVDLFETVATGHKQDYNLLSYANAIARTALIEKYGMLE